MTRVMDNLTLAQICLRSLQFAFAVIGASLRAPDLAHWNSANAKVNSRWIYAEFVAVASAISCVAQWWLAVHPAASCPWDVTTLLFWGVNVAVFQSFSRPRIEAAISMNAVSMLLWLATAVITCHACCAGRLAKPRIKRQRQRQRRMQPSGFETQRVMSPAKGLPTYQEANNLESNSADVSSIIDEKAARQERVNG